MWAVYIHKFRRCYKRGRCSSRPNTLASGWNASTTITQGVYTRALVPARIFHAPKFAVCLVHDNSIASEFSCAMCVTDQPNSSPGRRSNTVGNLSTSLDADGYLENWKSPQGGCSITSSAYMFQHGISLWTAFAGMSFRSEWDNWRYWQLR